MLLLITINETWDNGNEVQTTVIAMEIGTFTNIRKARKVGFVKTILFRLFDIKSLLYNKFVPTGQTVNQSYDKKF